MKAIRIITHRPEVIYTSSVLFILSKGLNAGKPLIKPCPNCFAVELESSQETQRFRSLCFVLFQSQIFKQYLKGSVVPFLSIGDFRSILNKYSELALNLPLDFEKLVDMLVEIEHQELANKKMMKLLSDYRKALISDFLKKI